MIRLLLATARQVVESTAKLTQFTRRGGPAVVNCVYGQVPGHFTNHAALIVRSPTPL